MVTFSHFSVGKASKNNHFVLPSAVWKTLYCCSRCFGLVSGRPTCPLFHEFPLGIRVKVGIVLRPSVLAMNSLLLAVRPGPLAQSSPFFGGWLPPPRHSTHHASLCTCPAHMPHTLIQGVRHVHRACTQGGMVGTVCLAKGRRGPWPLSSEE